MNSISNHQFPTEASSYSNYRFGGLNRGSVNILNEGSVSDQIRDFERKMGSIDNYGRDVRGGSDLKLLIKTRGRS